MAFSMTKREAELLDFIKARMADTGIAPSFAEMKDAIGIASKSGVHALISRLEQRGHIRRIKAHARAIEIIDTAPANVREALRAMNEAAYAAAKLAGKTQHPAAEAIRRIALDSDRILDEDTP